MGVLLRVVKCCMKGEGGNGVAKPATFERDSTNGQRWPRGLTPATN
jgi:hypothetical protein